MISTFFTIDQQLLVASFILSNGIKAIIILFVLWLLIQIFLYSGIRWRFLRKPIYDKNPVIGIRFSLSFFPGARRWRRIPILPKGDKYGDNIITWLWFALSWKWVTESIYKQY